MNPKTQQGIGAVGAIILVAVLALIGMVGTYAWNKRDDNVRPAATTTPQPTRPVPAWDAKAEFEKIQTGMTEAQVETAIGRSNPNGQGCTGGTTNGVYTKYCTYGDVNKDRALIGVTYTDNAVSDKQLNLY